MFLRSRADPIELRLLYSTCVWDERLVDYQLTERGPWRTLISNTYYSTLPIYGRNTRTTMTGIVVVGRHVGRFMAAGGERVVRGQGNLMTRWELNTSRIIVS